MLPSISLKNYCPLNNKNIFTQRTAANWILLDHSLYILEIVVWKTLSRSAASKDSDQPVWHQKVT